MGRKPRPVPTAKEMGEMKELWRKVLPRIEDELRRDAARVDGESDAARPPGAGQDTGKRTH